MQLGPRRRPGEPLSACRMRGAAYCALAALGLTFVALGLYFFRPHLGKSDLAHLVLFAALLAVGLGLPTMVFLTLGYLAGSLWAKREERNAPSQPAPERVLADLASPGFELAIDGSSGLWLGVFLAFVGIALAFLGPEEPLLMTGGVLGLALGAATVFAAVRTIGKPKLVLSAAGFQTPHTPFVPWSEVQGVYLRAMSYKGYRVYALAIRIETLPDRIHEFSAFQRFSTLLRRGAGKQKFFVPLRDASYPPALIYFVARKLWTEATGRDHDWNPDR